MAKDHKNGIKIPKTQKQHFFKEIIFVKKYN